MIAIHAHVWPDLDQDKVKNRIRILIRHGPPCMRGLLCTSIELEDLCWWQVWNDLGSDSETWKRSPPVLGTQLSRSRRNLRSWHHPLQLHSQQNGIIEYALGRLPEANSTEIHGSKYRRCAFADFKTKFEVVGCASTKFKIAVYGAIETECKCGFHLLHFSRPKSNCCLFFNGNKMNIPTQGVDLILDQDTVCKQPTWDDQWKKGYAASRLAFVRDAQPLYHLHKR